MQRLFFLSLKLNLVANQLLETEFCFNCEELASPGAFSLQVFNCRLVDLDLALGYCTLLPQKEVFENLWKLTDKAWQNYDKILAISLVGSQLASLCQETETKFKFCELSTDARWGIRLSKLGISFQPVFRQHFLTKNDLIKALVKNIDMDTSIILEYCR